MIAVTVACYVGGLTWSTLYAWVLMVLGVSAGRNVVAPIGRRARHVGHPAGLVCPLLWAVYSREIDYQAAELARERERALVAQGQARDAPLRALRYQLDPHFLFNALNAVSTLVAEGQGEAAQDMISRLSDFRVQRWMSAIRRASAWRVSWSSSITIWRSSARASKSGFRSRFERQRTRWGPPCPRCCCSHWSKMLFVTGLSADKMAVVSSSWRVAYQRSSAPHRAGCRAGEELR